MNDYYQDDPEWTILWDDIVPISHPRSETAVAQIEYTPEYEVIMDYFRALLRLGEKSNRALDLTKRVIHHNAANYTAWHYRRECLFALGSDLDQELAFITQAALDSPKNYQIWYHRRAIVEKLGNPSLELDFIHKILEDDSKNYHAWSYRQFVISHFKLWDGELEFTEKMIRQDIRNNSAWNQRWFVIEYTTGYSDDNVVAKEMKFTMEIIEMAPNNESPSNYLMGMFRYLRKNKHDALQVHQKAVLSWATLLLEDLEKNHNQDPNQQRSKPCTLLALVFEMYVLGNQFDQAIAMADDLANKYDPIRYKYWKYRKSKLSPQGHGLPVPAQQPVAV